LRAVLEAGKTLRCVAQQRGDRLVGRPLQLRRHAQVHTRHGGFSQSRVQYKYPGPVVGLQGDLVRNAGAVHPQLSRVLHGARKPRAQYTPFASVQRGQHRAAEVQIGLARRHTFESNSHRNAVVQRKRGNGAHLHALRQAAAPGHAVIWNTPQRRKTREQQEQHHHDRGAQQRHGCGNLC